MSLIQSLFLGILPASILMWMGNLVRATSTDEKTGKDWLFFLLSGFGLSIAALAIAASISEYAISLSVPVLLPITFGFALSLGFHLVRGKHTGKTKTALTWFGWNQNGKTYLLLFAIEVILLGVSIRVADTNHMADTTPHWLGSMLSTTSYIIVPWLGIVMAALLIRRVFSSEQPPTWHSTIPALTHGHHSFPNDRISGIADKHVGCCHRWIGVGISMAYIKHHWHWLSHIHRMDNAAQTHLDRHFVCVDGPLHFGGCPKSGNIRQGSQMGNNADHYHRTSRRQNR